MAAASVLLGASAAPAQITCSESDIRYALVGQTVRTVGENVSHSPLRITAAERSNKVLVLSLLGAETEQDMTVYFEPSSCDQATIRAQITDFFTFLSDDKRLRTAKEMSYRKSSGSGSVRMRDYQELGIR
jgi:hypothetical protein